MARIGGERRVRRQPLTPAPGQIAGVLVLLCLVAFASASRSQGREIGPGLAGFLVLTAAGVTAVAFAGAGLLVTGHALYGNTRLRTKGFVSVLLGLLLTALIAAMFIGAGEDDSSAPRKQISGPGFKARELAQTRGARDWAEPVAAGALIAALLIIVATVIIAERRRRALACAAGPLENEALTEALDESLDDLRQERDVRRAIIACYARMERALERAGSARRPAEAPFEYLVRILERITANGRAARILTELFERAKFSVGPMGEREKERAIGALERLRAEVRRPQ